MPIGPKDFAKHKLFIAHQILEEESVDRASKYVSGVHDAVKPLLQDAPELQGKLDDLDEFFRVCRDAAEAAEKEKISVGEYLKRLTKE